MSASRLALRYMLRYRGRYLAGFLAVLGASFVVMVPPFILGGAIAHQLTVGFVPIRKKGKLPGQTISQAYKLEYGEAIMEIHEDALQPGERVLIVDDLLATGGTCEAGIKLVERLGASVVGCAFVVDLPELGGRKLLERLGMQVHVLCEFEGA